MINIAVASRKHRRLKHGVYIDEAHNSSRLECINAHCWILSSDGKSVLLQKRSSSERFYSGLYDISIAGHIDEHENPFEAIKREAREEAGIKLDRFYYANPKKLYFTEIGNFAGHSFKHNQQAFVFYLVLSDKQIRSMRPDSLEVSKFTRIDLSNFIQKIELNDTSIAPHPKNYYRQVIRDLVSISKRLA